MVHFQCHVCDVRATCVVTNAAVLAWLDHMEIHAAKTAYDAWTWVVVPLEFE